MTTNIFQSVFIYFKYMKNFFIVLGVLVLVGFGCQRQTVVEFEPVIQEDLTKDVVEQQEAVDVFDTVSLDDAEFVYEVRGDASLSYYAFDANTATSGLIYKTKDPLEGGFALKSYLGNNTWLAVDAEQMFKMSVKPSDVYEIRVEQGKVVSQKIITTVPHLLAGLLVSQDKTRVYLNDVVYDGEMDSTSTIYVFNREESLLQKSIEQKMGIYESIIFESEIAPGKILAKQSAGDGGCGSRDTRIIDTQKNEVSTIRESSICIGEAPASYIIDDTTINGEVLNLVAIKELAGASAVEEKLMLINETTGSQTQISSAEYAMNLPVSTVHGGAKILTGGVLFIRSKDPSDGSRGADIIYVDLKTSTEKTVSTCISFCYMESEDVISDAVVVKNSKLVDGLYEYDSVLIGPTLSTAQVIYGDESAITFFSL